MERVIYSACYRLPGTSAAEFRDLLEMVEVWLGSLRGPGGFSGRVVLLTNERQLPFGDVEPIRLEDDARDRRGLFRQRPLTYDRLPVRPGESWMQLDADSIAQRTLDPLFAAAGDDTLRASPSGLTAIDNAAPLLGPLSRRWYSRVRGWKGRMGVSACLTSCLGDHWTRLMRPWADAIRRHHESGRQVDVGDQGFLNLMYMSGRVPIRPLPPGLIYHVRGRDDFHSEEARAAHLLHFPNPWRLELMRQGSAA